MQLPVKFNWSSFPCKLSSRALVDIFGWSCWWVWEDPWFPFITNALNAKELYIKDKAFSFDLRFFSFFFQQIWHACAAAVGVVPRRDILKEELVRSGSCLKIGSLNLPTDGKFQHPFPAIIQAYIVKRGEVMMLGTVLWSGCGHWGITTESLLAIESCKSMFSTKLLSFI